MITPPHQNLRPIFHFHLCSLIKTDIFKSKRFLSFLQNTGEKIKKIDSKRKNTSTQRGLFTTKISPEIGLLEIIHHAHWVKKEPSVIARLCWKIRTFFPTSKSMQIFKFDPTTWQRWRRNRRAARKRGRRKKSMSEAEKEERKAAGGNEGGGGGEGGGRGNYKNKSRRACSENKV